MQTRQCSLRVLLGWLWFLAMGVMPAWAEQYTFHHENVLGTSMQLVVRTGSAAEAALVEQTVLAEIDRLARIFSAHDSGSELMRWQAGQLNDDEVSPELVAVLSRAEHWRRQTAGAFDVRALVFSRIWKSAAKQQRLPDREAMKAIVGELGQAPYRIVGDRVERVDSMPITLDALAKGYILEAACREAGACYPRVEGLSLMIGGDLYKLGAEPEIFSISDPHLPDLNSPPKVAFRLNRTLGMATSGGYRRFVEIDGRRYSHIIDPRSAWPAEHVASVTVLAPRAMDADALATSVSVLGIREGLELIETLPETACMIVSNSGDLLYSQRWQELTSPVVGRLIVTQQVVSGSGGSQADPPKSSDKSAVKPKDGLFVNFTLKAAGGGRYRRPYVAVWLEDKDGYPVKTAVLWLQVAQPGPRWHRDLTRWYSNDRMRKLAEETELIGTVSGATRGPGQYEARFDGTDNAGQPLKPGKYMLCLEAAREHGTHQLIREEVELSDTATGKKELKGGDEISEASYSYAPKLESVK